MMKVYTSFLISKIRELEAGLEPSTIHLQIKVCGISHLIVHYIIFECIKQKVGENPTVVLAYFFCYSPPTK